MDLAELRNLDMDYSTDGVGNIIGGFCGDVEP